HRGGARRARRRRHGRTLPLVAVGRPGPSAAAGTLNGAHGSRRARVLLRGRDPGARSAAARRLRVPRRPRTSALGGTSERSRANLGLPLIAARHHDTHLMTHQARRGAAPDDDASLTALIAPTRSVPPQTTTTNQNDNQGVTT